MMKVFRKKFLFWACALLTVTLSLGLISCENDEVPSHDTPSAGLEVPDPYIQIQTPVIGFQAGTPGYEFGMNVINGIKDIEAVNVYSTFRDVAGKKSGEVLLTSYSLESSKRNIITDEFTYDELKAGIIINGQPLPGDQTALSVGAGWTFRFEGVRPDGTVIPLGGTVTVGVLHRFAGIYRVVESSYYRIGVFTGDWNNQTRFIGSVDDNTFSYNDFWGFFSWGGQQFNFDIDFNTNKITVPILTTSGLFSGDRAIRCDTDAGEFDSVPCDGSNIVIPDDATGKHTIKLTYGYFTTGSGPREFYEVLEKVVN